MPGWLLVELALLLQVVVFAVVVFAFLRSGRATVFHPLTFYLLFHAVSFVMRPTLIYLFDFHTIAWRIGYLPSEAEFAKTCIITSFGLAVIAFFTLRIRHERADPDPRGVSFDRIHEKAFWLACAVIAPLALYSMYLSLGGFGWEGYAKIQVVRNLEHGKFLYTNTTGYLAAAHTMLGYLAVIFMVKHRFRLLSLMPFCAYLVYRGILGHGRWFIILSLFTVSLLWLYENGKTKFKPAHYAVGFASFFLFNALGRNRNLIRDVFGIGSARDTTPLVDGMTWFERLDNLDFSAFDVVAAVTNIVPQATNSYTYFSQYLQLLTQPIPRILWPGKPVGSPIEMFNLMDYGNFWRLPPSIIGDGWMSLGWPGVFVTLAVVGTILGKLHSWFWQRRDNPFVVVTYCCFLPITIQWFRDGGISIAVFSFFVLGPVGVWYASYRCLRMFRHRSAPAAVPSTVRPLRESGQGQGVRRAA